MRVPTGRSWGPSRSQPSPLSPPQDNHLWFELIARRRHRERRGKGRGRELGRGESRPPPALLFSHLQPRSHFRPASPAPLFGASGCQAPALRPRATSARCLVWRARRRGGRPEGQEGGGGRRAGAPGGGHGRRASGCRVQSMCTFNICILI